MKVKVCVVCNATYTSEIDVPAGMSEEEIIEYAQDHIDELCVGDDLEWVDGDEEVTAVYEE